MIKVVTLALSASLVGASADVERLKIVLVPPGGQFQCASPKGCVVMDTPTFDKVLNAARRRGQSDCEKAI